jgi:hypothetical protein
MNNVLSKEKVSYAYNMQTTFITTLIIRLLVGVRCLAILWSRALYMFKFMIKHFTFCNNANEGCLIFTNESSRLNGHFENQNVIKGIFNMNITVFKLLS